MVNSPGALANPNFRQEFEAGVSQQLAMKVLTLIIKIKIRIIINFIIE